MMNARLSEQDLAQASMPRMNTMNASSSELDLAQARFPRSGSWMLAQASKTSLKRVLGSSQLEKLAYV